MLYNRGKGFTLAEVLITIALIGIIAALTLPSLKNVGNSHIGTELATVTSTLEQSVQQFMVDNNSNYLTVAMKKAGASNFKVSTLLQNYLLNDYIKGTSTTLQVTKSYTWSRKASQGLSSQSSAIRLPNQAAIAPTTDCALTESTTSYCGLTFYASGYAKKKSLITANDVFQLYITNEGKILIGGSVEANQSPYSIALWSTSNNCDDSGMKKHTATGVGCAGRIAERGWKVDY